jgi:hypothetical protein
MKIIKTDFIVYLKLATVAVLLFAGGNLNADETEKKQKDIKAETKISTDTKNTKTGKDTDKKTKTFKPTEEVSADQAVAFPTDI